MGITTSATTATRQHRPHPLMTRAEVARLLRVDPTTVDSWRRQHRIPSSAVVELPGGGYRYRRTFFASLAGL